MLSCSEGDRSQNGYDETARSQSPDTPDTTGSRSPLTSDGNKRRPKNRHGKKVVPSATVENLERRIRSQKSVYYKPSACGTRTRLGISSQVRNTAWLEKSPEHDLHDRIVFFDTIGRAPVEQPVHAARLTPIRQMSSPVPSAAHIEDDAACTSRDNDRIDGLHTALSQHCCDLCYEQHAIHPFVGIQFYLDCDFFKGCSYNFICDLIKAGGDAASVGRTIPSCEVIFQKHDPGQSMYIVVRGTAESIEIGPVGTLRCVRAIPTGSCFGEQQVLGVLSRRHETVRAKTSVHVLEVTSTTLTEALKLLRVERKENSITPEPTCRQYISPHDRKYPDERKYFESEIVRMHREIKAERKYEVLKPGALPTNRDLVGPASSSPKHQFHPAFDPFRQDIVAERDIDQAQLHENYMAQLEASIRKDLRSGFMMPAGFQEQVACKNSIPSASQVACKNSIAASGSRASSKFGWASPAPTDYTQIPTVSCISGRQTSSSNRSSSTWPSPSNSRMSPRWPSPSHLSCPAPTSRSSSVMNHVRVGSSRASHGAASPAALCDDAGASLVSGQNHDRVDVEASTAQVKEDSFMEVDCLPDIADLSSKQKWHLLRQLKRRIKQRLPGSCSRVGSTSRYSNILNSSSMISDDFSGLYSSVMSDDFTRQCTPFN